MASNERRSLPGTSGQAGSQPGDSKDTLRTETIQIERKSFAFSLKENPRGRFLRITEDAGGRRDTIIVPATGLEEFNRVLGEMVTAAAGSAQAHQP